MATPSRRYYSPTRSLQADKTRRRIVDAARRLFGRDGYGATTIADIAKEAGVAVQTVYAVFGSKQGILKGLVERAAFGLEYDKLIAAWEEQGAPADRLRFAAKIACEIYAAERTELEFLRKAGVVAPETSAIAPARDAGRFAAQRAMIGYLKSVRALRSGLTPAAAHDILWTLTGRDVFHRLTAERGWSVARYRNWLGNLLVKELLGEWDARPSRRAGGRGS